MLCSMVSLADSAKLAGGLQQDTHSLTDYANSHLVLLQKEHGTCEQIVSKLHAATTLLQARYQDDITRGRGLVLCSHNE